MNFPFSLAPVAFLALTLSTASLHATSNYDYGEDEYPTISRGISPDRKLAITAHGDGELGYGNFHLYLFDAQTSKKIGALEEITEFLDTGARSFIAKWSKDSSEVTIVYRVNRHAPLKAMTYRLEKGRAIPATQEPVDVEVGTPLQKLWSNDLSKTSEKTFGTPNKEKK